MSNVLMVIATIVIAVFSGISCFVAYLIHQATTKRDNETKDILKKLTAASLADPSGAGLENALVRSYKNILNELDNLE